MNLIKNLSPNYESRRGIIPCLIVNHITGGDRASSALNWFANPQSQTSSNYIVDTNGDIYECVPLQYAAWANGTTTVSTSKVYYGNAVNPVVKQRGGNANLYSVSIEHVNEWGGNLTEKQLAATIELHGTSSRKSSTYTAMTSPSTATISPGTGKSVRNPARTTPARANRSRLRRFYPH